MTHQAITTIPLKELVLWTENPRDPIKADAVDQDIADIAFGENRDKWSLEKLAKEMGGYFDFSEIPTVVYHDKTPVVYDGNRRVLLGKVKHSLLSAGIIDSSIIPDYPDAIPCNVCSKSIALRNVYRKHAESGSWLPLERDIFLHKHMGEPKSTFLIFEEHTGLISGFPELNKRFVKEEVFKDEQLHRLGFEVRNGQLYSCHSKSDARDILFDVAKNVEDKNISTRKNRGKVLDVLAPSTIRLVEKNKAAQKTIFDENIGGNINKDLYPFSRKRQPKRVKKNSHEIFGGKLYIKSGNVGNLYRDIRDLYLYYSSRKSELSNSFPNVIRMSLRLLCEAASKDLQISLSEYVDSYFEESAKYLNKDDKTTLSTQNITKKSMIPLLHVGAHQYKSSANLEQTIAMSLVIGGMITITHTLEKDV